MLYQSFVRVLSQLSQKNHARVEVENREILIRKKQNKWLLSTLIFHNEKILEEFQSLSLFRWQAKGAFIQVNFLDQTMHLVQEIELPKSILWKTVMVDFLSQAEEWQFLLYDMAEKEKVC